ncbi:MAG TPA: hypothetical protein PKA82_04670 [Pyrinomonadaceae bacterium]|nr:hypothetical protein [Pyrinomonadaceae bacterium]
MKMFRLNTTLFLIYSILLTTFSMPALAQPSANVVPNDDVLRHSTKAAPDIKKAIDEQSKELRRKSETFDPVAYERIERRQTKKGWSKSDKILMAAFVVGITVLVVLLVKYGKNCIRTSPPNCNIGTDDNCYCEEYEQENRPGR